MKTYKFGDNIQALINCEWVEAKYVYKQTVDIVYYDNSLFHLHASEIRPSSKPNMGDEVNVRDKGDKEWYPNKETYIGEYGVRWVTYDGYNLCFWDEVKKVEDEQPTELTLDQIEEKLGMKIKIINPIK